MEKEKSYLKLFEVQNNLKLAEIKKNKVVKSSISVSGNNSNERENNLENDVASKIYNPFQIYDRPFCKD